MTKPQNGHGDSRPSSRTLADKRPPASIEAEQGCLGSILLDNATLHDVVEETSPQEFHRHAHQIIARVVWDLYGEGRPIDGITLADELKRRHQLDEVGGDDYLFELLQSTPHAVNARYYAEIVHQLFIGRRVIEIANEMLRQGYSAMMSGDELVAMAEREVFALGDQRAESGVSPMYEAVGAAIDRIDDRRDGCAGLRTGLADLDDMIDGFHPGKFYILAARPSIGKSACACNFLEHVAIRLDRSVMMVSLEMDKTEIAERLVSSLSGVSNYKLRHGRMLSEDEHRRVGDMYQVFRDHKVYIDDSPARTPLKIAAAARRTKHRHGLDLLIVDYLQLVDPEDPKDTRQEQVAKISRRMKWLSRELNVPLLGLCQLNRQVETREKRVPRMADLRESGSLEQDADVVMLLHRPDYYDSTDRPGYAELIVAKNRNGATGTVKLAWRKEVGRFESFCPVPAIDPQAASTVAY